MNIDDLVQCIPDSDLEIKEALAAGIRHWKNSDQPIEKLVSMVNKWHGNVWPKEKETIINFNNCWSKFKIDAIENIGGLTMNERLYWFGLIGRWDNSSDSEKLEIRDKLKANA